MTWILKTTTTLALSQHYLGNWQNGPGVVTTRTFRDGVKFLSESGVLLIGVMWCSRTYVYAAIKLTLIETKLNYLEYAQKVEIQIQWSEESNKIESKAQMQHSWGIPNISLINRAVKKPSNASDVCFVVCNFDEPQ